MGDCPSKLIYDKAAGYGKTRSQVDQASQGRCCLSARLPDLEQRSPRFSPYAFSLSPDGAALACPAGKVSQHLRSADDVDGVVFPCYAWQCWNGDPPIPRQKASLEEALTRRCLLWEQCRDPRTSYLKDRTVFISNYRNLVLAAQVYNQSEEFQAPKHCPKLVLGSKNEPTMENMQPEMKKFLLLKSLCKNRSVNRTYLR